MTRLIRVLSPLLLGGWMGWIALFATAAEPPPLPPAEASQLPLWRGFNLLEKFQRDRDAPFREKEYEDFHGHQLDRALLELLQRYR